MSNRIASQALVGNPATGITNALGDVVLDSQGQIMGYEMAEVSTEGRVAVANWIDVKATRSLGPDVLIVKSEFV